MLIKVQRFICTALNLNNSPIGFGSICVREMSSSLKDLIEKAKKEAAYRAVDDYVKDGMKLGVGSGSTIVYAVERLAERVQRENLQVFCIPTSFQAQQLIYENNLILSNLDSHPELDCVIDGADEVDSELSLIKGGGGCLTQEKIVSASGEKLIIVADYTKKSKKLGENYEKIPIEIIPMSRAPVSLKITAKFGGDIVLRMGGKVKAGPVITDNGGWILDWIFPKNLDAKWDQVNSYITSIPGVIETGLFVRMASSVYFGMADGSVSVVK